MSARISVEETLRQSPEWEAVDGRDAITRTFRFRDFNAAWAFMSQIAEKANAMDHHPEWSNVYGQVVITLSTHDANGLTLKDVELAVYANTAAAAIGKRES